MKHVKKPLFMGAIYGAGEYDIIILEVFYDACARKSSVRNDVLFDRPIPSFADIHNNFSCVEGCIFNVITL